MYKAKQAFIFCKTNKMTHNKLYVHLVHTYDVKHNALIILHQEKQKRKDYNYSLPKMF